MTGTTITECHPPTYVLDSEGDRWDRIGTWLYATRFPLMETRYRKPDWADNDDQWTPEAYETWDRYEAVVTDLVGIAKHGPLTGPDGGAVVPDPVRDSLQSGVYRADDGALVVLGHGLWFVAGAGGVPQPPELVWEGLRQLVDADRPVDGVNPYRYLGPVADAGAYEVAGPNEIGQAYSDARAHLWWVCADGYLSGEPKERGGWYTPAETDVLFGPLEREPDEDIPSTLLGAALLPLPHNVLPLRKRLMLHRAPRIHREFSGPCGTDQRGLRARVRLTDYHVHRVVDGTWTAFLGGRLAGRGPTVDGAIDEAAKAVCEVCEQRPATTIKRKTFLCGPCRQRRLAKFHH